MSGLWQEAWFAGLRSRTALLWRGVEAQHLIATLRLTDTAADHRLLEELLERSKPPLPQHTHSRHYLLTTPFRYRSPVASRFRRAQEPGAWYGAEDLRTACAEVGYWRWRFLNDSDGLAAQALHTTHSFFRAQVRGRCLDLTRAPWSTARQSWRDPRDYGACQALAAAAHTQRVAWIRYQSARVEVGICGAAFEVAALTLSRTSPMQTWVCRSTRSGVRLQRSGAAGESFEFDVATWA
ncbi:MAG: RES family NAD+ phosphorylase [Steroidobacteraceae bacterium]